MDLIKKANKIYFENWDNKTYFERALFFSWYCKYGDCSFCYMSTLKDKLKDPKKARRRFSSIIAEAILCKHFGWKIEFISGGYESYTTKELLSLIKIIYEINKEKLWLNIGTLNKEELSEFKPYIQGYAGTVECVNWNLREKICPSKKMHPILETFKHCDELKIKKAMTLIIGLGENINDFENLKSFIKENKISRITFYALNPHENTIFKKSPDIEYYEEWIAKTRIEFPNLEIIAGAWSDKTNYYSRLLIAGANSITKLPSLRKFASKEFFEIENEIKKAGRVFVGSLTKLQDIDLEKKINNLKLSENEKTEIKLKLKEYIKKIKKN